jgi:hypothetical protein
MVDIFHTVINALKAWILFFNDIMLSAEAPSFISVLKCYLL